MNSSPKSSAGWGLMVLRVVVGIVFAMHGGQKLFVMGIPAVSGFFTHLGVPLAHVSAVLVTLVEFLGGIALILGLGTRWAAILLALDMAGAIFFVHGKNGFLLPMGFEFVLTLLAANVALALAGPGAASVDRVVFHKN